MWKFDHHHNNHSRDDNYRPDHNYKYKYNNHSYSENRPTDDDNFCCPFRCSLLFFKRNWKIGRSC